MKNCILFLHKNINKLILLLGLICVSDSCATISNYIKLLTNDALPIQLPLPQIPEPILLYLFGQVLQSPFSVFVVLEDGRVGRRRHERLYQVEFRVLVSGGCLQVRGLVLVAFHRVVVGIRFAVTRLLLFVFDAGFVEFVAAAVKDEGFYSKILTLWIEAEAEINSHRLGHWLTLASCSSTGSVAAHIERKDTGIEKCEPVGVLAAGLLANMLPQFEEYISVNEFF